MSYPHGCVKVRWAAATVVTIALSSAAWPQEAKRTSPEGKPPVLKAPALQSGDTLALVAPAGPIDQGVVQHAATQLRQRGYRVRIAAGSDQRLGYLAGNDHGRSESLNAAIRDPKVKAIVCLRGGYGTPRILDAIDYASLRRNPKILVGYSDITALLVAVNRRTGLVVFHGPMGKEWGTGITAFSESRFWDSVRSNNRYFGDWGRSGKKTKTLRPGRAKGTLMGGNLSVICSLIGTPFEIDTTDTILFLEDVGEKMFRIDRMLNQLKLAGKLRGVRGIILGAFNACEKRVGDVTLEELFLDYFEQLGVPVLAEFPAGHVPDNVTLPLGARVLLDATATRVSILEAPVTSQ